MYATREYIQMLASGLSGQTGITITEGANWATDMKKRRLVYVMNDLKNQSFGVVRGLLLHEIGHIKYSTLPKDSPYIKKYGRPFMNSVYNCFEDWRIEIKLIREYGAYAHGAISEMNYRGVYQRLIESGGDMSQMTKWEQFCMVASYAHISRVHYDVQDLVGEDARFFVHPNYRSRYGFIMDTAVADSLYNHEYELQQAGSLMCNAQSMHELQDVVDKVIMPMLVPFLDEQVQQQQKQQQQQQQQGGMSIEMPDSGGGRPQPQSPNQQQQQQQQAGGGSQQKDSEESEEEQKSGSGGVSKGKEEKKADAKEDSQGSGQDKNNNTDQKKEEKKADGGGAGDKPEPEELEEQQQHSPTLSIAHGLMSESDEDFDEKEKSIGNQRLINVIGRGSGGPRRRFEKPTVAEATTLLNPYSITLATRLVSILKEAESTRWTGNHLTGRLLSRNAYKVMIKDESRIFSRRSNPNKPKYSVYLALDNSGSMQGSKALYTYLASVMLKEVCRRLDFDTKIYSFDDVAHELQNLENYSGTGGGTRDESALSVIDKHITGDGESIVFVITDGETSVSSGREKMFARMKAHGAYIFGIGIGREISPEVIKKNYPVGMHVSKVEELPMVLINTMKQVIHR